MKLIQLIFFVLLFCTACTTMEPARPAETPTAPPTLAPTALAPSATPLPPTLAVPLPTPSPTLSSIPAFDPGPNDFFVAPNGNDANPGTFDQPWATLNFAAVQLKPGQTVYVRGGVYPLERQILLKFTGAPGQWITLRAYPGEQPILDASAINNAGPGSFSHDAGTINLVLKSYIRVIGLTVRNSHQMGIIARDSSHIEIINNFTDTTYGPGIAAWDTDADSQGTEFITVTANTVTNANTWDMLPNGYVKKGEPPHEAISIAGAQYFEVADNYVYSCDKEGIDVKEVSKHGKVHHNYVVDCARQGIYVDAWFGAIEDIEIYENVIQHNGGPGFALSVENGSYVSGVNFHHNLVFNNLGAGVLFSRWGEDGPRRGIQIHHNTIYRNGCGWPSAGQRFYYITGGIYLFSSNLTELDIRNNVVSENCAFQIGYSEAWETLDPDPVQALSAAGVTVDYNLIYQVDQFTYPVFAGGGNGSLYAWPISGTNTIQGDPLLVDVLNFKFWALDGSPIIDAGDPATSADPDGSPPDLGALWTGADRRQWWRISFPPIIEIK